MLLLNLRSKTRGKSVMLSLFDTAVVDCCSTHLSQYFKLIFFFQKKDGEGGYTQCRNHTTKQVSLVF